MWLLAISVWGAPRQATASEAYQQRRERISVSFRNASLAEVLQRIKQQTGYYILYNSDAVRGIGGISFSKADAPVREVLDEALRGTRLEYSIDDDTIVIRGRSGGGNASAPQKAPDIIGKTKCDEIKNEMRPSWRKAWSKRNATKISHTRKNTVRTTTKRCSNGIFLSQKQRSLRSLLVIANHPLLLSTTTRFRGTDGPLDAVDDPPVALGVSVDHIERKHRQHKLSLHCLE